MGAHHVINAKAHHGSHQDHDRLSFAAEPFGLLQRVDHVFHDIAIHMQHDPAKGSPFRFQVPEVHHLACWPVNLLAIPVHRADQVVHLVMRGGHHRFPDLPFLKFSITSQHIDQAGIIINLFSNGSPDSHRQSLAKRTRGHPDTR